MKLQLMLAVGMLVEGTFRVSHIVAHGNTRQHLLNKRYQVLNVQQPWS